MSTGDIDDRLGPEGELEELRLQYPELEEYLSWAWGLKPVRTFFIPYAAGISADGKRVYISYDIQSSVEGIDCESALVRHETTEWGLRRFCLIGEDYITDPRGHRLSNRAEHDRIVQLLGGEDAWDIYTEIIDPQVINAERGDFEDRPIPQDLALYPYDQEEQEKLITAMWNERSQEEWNKLSAI